MVSGINLFLGLFFTVFRYLWVAMKTTYFLDQRKCLPSVQCKSILLGWTYIPGPKLNPPTITERESACMWLWTFNILSPLVFLECLGEGGYPVSSESLQRDEGGMDANYQCTLFKGDNFLKFKCVQITYVTQSWVRKIESVSSQK